MKEVTWGKANLCGNYLSYYFSQDTADTSKIGSFKSINT